MTPAGLSSPNALAFDSSGNLYVVNNGNSTVQKFGRGHYGHPDFLHRPIQPGCPGFRRQRQPVRRQPSSNIGVSKFSITALAASVTIQSSVESRPMLIGGTNSSPVAGINLSSAELRQIVTTATGLVTIGDVAQTGNITLTTAIPTTTPGASLNVLESATGAGQIILNDATGTGTGLNDNGSEVSLTPGTGGIQSTLYATGTPLVTNGFVASGETLNLALGFAPTIGTKLTVISNTALPASSNPIGGTFTNLPQGGTVSLSYLGTPYSFTVNYQGGDGNDLVLTNIAIPAQIAVISQPPSTVTAATGFSVAVAIEALKGMCSPILTAAWPLLREQSGPWHARGHSHRDSREWHGRILWFDIEPGWQRLHADRYERQPLRRHNRRNLSESWRGYATATHGGAACLGYCRQWLRPDGRSRGRGGKY